MNGAYVYVRLLMLEHSSVDQSFLTKTNTSTVCGWKGTASYYTINVDGMEAEAEEFHMLPLTHS